MVKDQTYIKLVLRKTAVKSMNEHNLSIINLHNMLTQPSSIYYWPQEVHLYLISLLLIGYPYTQHRKQLKDAETMY